MKYQETGFRALYKNFAAFPLNDRFRKAMEGYPNVDDANCMLVYGYIDHEAGLTLEVLAAGIEREERFKFFDPSEDTRFFIRVGAVEDEEFALFDDSDTYAIVGTTVIRTSYLLTNEEQFELTDKITQALTKQ